MQLEGNDDKRDQAQLHHRVVRFIFRRVVRLMVWEGLSQGPVQDKSDLKDATQRPDTVIQQS
jgi:hypothetical protein